MKLLFSVIFSHKSRNIIKNLISKGKEKDSFLVPQHMSKISIITSIITRGITPRFPKKRVTSYISHKKGSVTVEAALVVPIFLYAIICIVYLLQISAIQTTVRTSMNEVYHSLSQKMYVVSYISANQVEEAMIESIGRERLDNSIVTNGSHGIDCSQSYASIWSGIITLKANYCVKLPFPMFTDLGLTFSETVCGKG